MRRSILDGCVMICLIMISTRAYQQLFIHVQEIKDLFIVPHKDFDHPFVGDYYDEITASEAETRIRVMLGRNEERLIEKVQRWGFW